MSRPTLMTSIWHAVLCSLLTMTLLQLSRVIFPFSALGTLMLCPIVSCYTYLLYHNRNDKKGLLICLGTYVSMAFLSLLLPGSQLVFCFAMLFVVWLTRIFLHQKNMGAILMDAALVIFGFIWSAWIYNQSHSINLSLWTFLLSQSLWVLIPISDHQRNKEGSFKETQFDLAFQKAEHALHQLNN